MDKDKDYPPESGILPQYAHLKGMAENMKVIRKLLGLPEYGRLPNTSIGRALQKLVDNNRKDDVRES
jgi:hypothetical protein